jgi:glycosyltransferase involved in cell wall biosynthesis
MTARPGVAVIVPAYRAATTLGAVLASVAGQTLLPAEVVVVDDGSDDATAEVAERWTDLLPLTVVRQANAGPAAARRRAMEVAGSPLVALLDADDVWLPNHLGALADVFDRNGGGIVSANALSWRPGEGVAGRSWQDRYPVPAPDRQRLAILRRNFVFVGALFSADAAFAVGGFRDGFSGAEDWDLWIRMIRAGSVIHASTAPTVLYRTTDSSLTAGSRIHDVYAAVLERAREETTTDGERRVIDGRLRRLQARRHLAGSYAAARSGRRALARAEARQGAWGSPAMAVQAAGLLAAPATVARWGERLRARRR